MAELRYVGAAAADPNDIGYRGYVSRVKSADMSSEAIDLRIEAGLSGYALKSYADERDQLLATPAYIDAADATRVKLAQKDAPNGVAALQADTGRVHRNLINAASGQRYPVGLWAPGDYGSPVATDTETTVFAWDITDPGITYRLMVMGSLAVASSHESALPEIRVRVGDPEQGPVIASGRGSYGPLPDQDGFSRTGSDLGDGWDEHWTGTGTGHVQTGGGQAFYVTQGSSSTREGIFVRTGSVSPGDSQEISWTFGEENGSTNATRPCNYVFGRASADGQNWVGVNFRSRNNAADATEANRTVVHLAACVDGVISDISPGIWCPITSDAVYRLVIGTPGQQRRVLLYRGETLIFDLVEFTHTVGQDYRGWGFGMRAGSTGFAQIAPAGVDHILMRSTDHTSPATRTGSATVFPLDYHAQQPLTGPVTLYVNVASVGAPGAFVSAGYEGNMTLSALAIPA
mgnify:CR=1 FL=1